MKLLLRLLVHLVSAAPLFAGCCEFEPEGSAFDRSTAVAEYRIVSRSSYFTAQDTIATRYTAERIETFKGAAPIRFQFIRAGGTLGRREEWSSEFLDLTPGHHYVLHLEKSPDDSWNPRTFHTRRMPAEIRESRMIRDFYRGRARGASPMRRLRATTPTAPQTDLGTSGIPGSTVTATGYTETSGQPTRFTACDGGLAIPYLVDLDPALLPTGMNSQAALAAVEEALAAWSSVTSLKFRFDGAAPFGTAANSIPIPDGRIRIQLHDKHNAVGNGTLGIGGGASESASAVFTGGSVAGQGFQERLRGFVVLNHDQAFMASSVNFKQVLTHELGHALGLAHSSNNPSEPNAILRNATMYYTSSNDGRGAALTVYDEDRIAFAYPSGNTPPYTIDRFIPAVSRSTATGSLPVGTPGVNAIDLRVIDLQGDPLTVALGSGSDSKFSLVGQQLRFASGTYTAAARLSDSQIAQGSFYSRAFFQFSDGVNLSRPATCAVISYQTDSTPEDGLPDAWMTTHFGTQTPGEIGSDRHPDDDPDGDGLTNREEFYLNTDPNSAASGPPTVVYDHAAGRITVSAPRFAPLWLESSSSLGVGSWQGEGIDSPILANELRYWNLPRPITVSSEFYRVFTGP